MMRKMVVLGVALVLSFVFCSVSEAVSLKSRILGKWVNNDRKEGEIQQYEFLKDGTVVVVIQPLSLLGRQQVSSAGHFSFIDDNRLKIDFGSGLLVFEVSFDKEGQLNLKDATGKVRGYLSEAEWKKREEVARAEREKRIAAERAEKKKRIKEKFVFSDFNVLDNETKLMWTRDGNIAGKEMNWHDAFKFIDSLNEQKYAGYNDWRLPSKEELETLINFAKGQGVTEEINRFFNEIGFKDVQAHNYWSSTTGVGLLNKDLAWDVNMGNGKMSLFNNKTLNYHVLPVRVENPAIKELEKRIKEKFVFSDLNVLDNETKLMWARDGNIAGKMMNWHDAFKFIDSLNEQKYAGYNDWRLPSKEDLETLVNFAKGQGDTKELYRHFDNIVFKNVQVSGYWSSTTVASNSSYAWYVNFFGRVSGDVKSHNFYVRCVRAGQ